MLNKIFLTSIALAASTSFSIAGQTQDPCATYFQKIKNLAPSQQDDAITVALFKNLRDLHNNAKWHSAKEDHIGVEREAQTFLLASESMCKNINSKSKMKKPACNIKKIRDDYSDLKITTRQVFTKIDEINSQISNEFNRRAITDRQIIGAGEKISICAMSNAAVKEAKTGPIKISNHRLKQITEEMTRSMNNGIPMQIGQSVTLIGVKSHDNLISMTARLNYPRSQFNSALSSTGKSIAEVRRAHMQHATTALCRDESLTRGYMNLGGTFMHVYVLPDGGKLFDFKITRCPQ